MMLGRAAIESRVPQAGDMCLIDAVRQWDAKSIVCTAPPVGTAHPLARGDLVPVVVAAEYAAQAAAIHGALLDGDFAPVGLLAKLSNVTLRSKPLSAEDGPLAVRAQLVSRGASGCLYDFEVSSALQPVAHGRLMVAFTASSVR